MTQVVGVSFTPSRVPLFSHQVAYGYRLDNRYRQATTKLATLGVVYLKFGKTERELPAKDVLQVLARCKAVLDSGTEEEHALTPAEYAFFVSQVEWIRKARTSMVIGLPFLMRLRKIAARAPQ